MNTNISKFRKLKSHKGFSLVELLVVIAIIGIIAAIAIPNIGSLTGSADTAKDQRNAQTIASVSSAAIAAGREPLATSTTEIAALIAGVGGEGTLTNATFKVDITTTDYDTAKSFLDFSGGATGTGFSYKKGEGTAQ